MNDIREKAKKALDRVRLFDDSKEIADYLYEIDDYWAQEGCVHIEGMWKLTKQLKQVLSRAIKHINDLEAELANAQRKPLTDQEVEALNNLPSYLSDAEVIAFARRIEQAHGIK